jgi:O-antigen/teichoic acid export membrane protein
VSEMGIRGRFRRLAGSTAGHLTRHSVAYGAASAIGKLASLATVPYLTRQLSPDGYGLADLATSLAAFLAIVVRFSGDIPAARLLGSRSDHERRVVLTSFVVVTATVSTAAALLLLPTAPLVAAAVWNSPDSSLLAVLALALVPISATQAALVNVQRLQAKPTTFAVLATVDLLAQAGLAVVFVALGYGPMGVVIGFILGSVVGLFAGIAAASSTFRSGVDLALGARIVREGLPFLPSVVAFMAADYVTRFLIVDELGQAGAGFYGLALRLASVIGLAAAAFSLAWGPYGLQMEKTAETARLFARVLLAYSVPVAFGSVLLSALAPEIVLLISGREYLPASEAMPGLLLSAGMTGAFYVLVVGAGITGRGNMVAVASVVGAVAQVALIGVLLPAVGLDAVGAGAVVGRTASILVLAPAVWVTFGGGRRLLGFLLASAILIVLALGALNASAGDSLVVRVSLAGLWALGTLPILRAWWRLGTTGRA